MSLVVKDFEQTFGEEYSDYLLFGLSAKEVKIFKHSFGLLPSREVFSASEINKVLAKVRKNINPPVNCKQSFKKTFARDYDPMYLRGLSFKEMQIVSWYFGIGYIRPLSFAEIVEALAEPRYICRRRLDGAISKIKNNINPHPARLAKNKRVLFMCRYRLMTYELFSKYTPFVLDYYAKYIRTLQLINQASDLNIYHLKVSYGLKLSLYNFGIYTIQSLFSCPHKRMVGAARAAHRNYFTNRPNSDVTLNELWKGMADFLTTYSQVKAVKAV